MRVTPGTVDAAPSRSPAGAAPSGRRTAVVLLIDVALPIGTYYGLRAAGVSVFLALVISAVVPLVSALVQFRRERRWDGMAAFVAAIMLAGMAASLVSGSTRFLLAKDGWLTGAAGLWFLASIRASRPLAFHGARPFLEGRFRSGGISWDVLWEQEPRFRHIWRVSTAIWAAAMILDGAARVVMAYSLPVDLVPALGGLLWPVTLVLLQVVTGVYYQVAGLWGFTSRSPRPAANDESAAAPAAESG
ncbi:VC0807 family protein [Streptacidiphilus sp. EB129]|uniref:VC0807 family protein n=1 Tax=Streptacidiphilus sp. EB129 TaxID=3156262 RepID=UPI00351147F7